MITLFHAPRSRSSRFLWLLEEIGEPYEVKPVVIRGRQSETGPDPAYRQIHPHGKVPAIVHDGQRVFESAAIALYLADAFPAAKLGPAIGAPARGQFLTLLAYYAGVMEPAFVGKALGFTTTNSTTGWAPTEEVIAFLVETLGDRPYLLGDQFSAADVLFGSTFALFRASPLLPPTPVISAYVDRLTQRPAYQTAMKRDVQ